MKRIVRFSLVAFPFALYKINISIFERVHSLYPLLQGYWELKLRTLLKNWPSIVEEYDWRDPRRF